MAFVVPSEQAALQAFIARRHPEYADKASLWVFNEATYKGGDAWLRANVDRYIKEGDKEYEQRVARAYSFPHTREVVDLIQKYIFKSDIARNTDDASAPLKKFWKKATLAGLSIDQFMRLVCNKSSIYGRAWVFVDSNKTDAIVSVADEKKSGARTYAYIVAPQDVLDMGYADDGSLEWIKVREYHRDDSDPFSSTGKVVVKYRLWSRDHWWLFRAERRKVGGADMTATVDDATQKQYETSINSIVAQQKLATPDNGTERFKLDPNLTISVEAEGPVAINCVPAFPVDHVIGDGKYSAPGLIDSIARLEKKVLNYLSSLDEIIYGQTFSQLVMPGQGVNPGDDLYDKMLEMGTKRIFLYNSEGGAAPSFISPDVKQAEMVLVAINKIINEIYHTVGMGAERTKQDNSVGIDNSSGVAKAYDFERLNSLLTTKSASLQNAEGNLIQLVARWNGQADYVYGDDDKEPALVQYADTFDVRSLYDVFTELDKLILASAPEVILQEQMRAVAAKLFPTAAKKLAKEIEKQIKAWPPEPPPPLAVTGTMSPDPSSTKPAITGQQKPAAPAGGAAPDTKTPATKNAGTTSRQGQVTSETK